MNNLNQVKHALFTACSLDDALAKLSALNISVTQFPTYCAIDPLGIIFFSSRKYSLPLAVTIASESPAKTVLEYQSVYAQQQEQDSASQVPASASPVAAGQPVAATELNLIKTVLFNAQSVNQALAFLDDLGISYRRLDMIDIYAIDTYSIRFWKSRSSKSFLTVSVNDCFIDHNARLPFLAPQKAPDFSHSGVFSGSEGQLLGVAL